MVERARAAQAAIDHFTAEQVDELTTAVAYAVARKDRAEQLARLAVDEAGFGNYDDKVTKIQRRVLGVLSDLRATPTVGVVAEDPERGLTQIAKPVGVVAALVPTTGPDATPPVKALWALAGRNAVVFAAHPRSAGTTRVVVDLMRDACEQVGAPSDLVQVLPEPKIAATQELMRLADLVVATGGAAMVKAAYSSGTPAFGVGVGNCVHVVDETADLVDAANAIAVAKTFDHATSCLADNAVIVHDDVHDELLGLLRARGGHLCSAEQKRALQAVMWRRGRARARNPHRAGAGEPEPQRGCGQPPQRAALHAQPRLRDLGRHHHNGEPQRPAFCEPDLGVQADRAPGHRRGRPVRRARPAVRSMSSMLGRELFPVGCRRRGQ
ncbi:MAG: sulfoacetaldehyde dehydrogenase [Pseudonocardiales bacterium]|nr:sulfoacetaldehyde dehydrogenase [Pseudonocardiales bacterium]